MISNIDMLNHILSERQFGFIKVVRHYSKEVERTCYGETDCCNEPHPYWERVSGREIIVSGMLRNYTVRENDILFTVLPWDEGTKSFAAKRQFKYLLREKFEYTNGTLVRRAWGYDIDLEIELSSWAPATMW